MAALLGCFAARTVPIVGGIPQTVLQILTPINQRIKIRKTTISFDGVNSANTPAQVTILRQSGGNFAYPAGPTKVNGKTGQLELLQTIGKTGVYDGNPADLDILETYTLKVYNGTLILPANYGRGIIVSGGTAIGWKVAANSSFNATVSVIYEE